jgi:hypothetical protein
MAQKRAKHELGWADFRITDYGSIERWWELVSCTYPWRVYRVLHFSRLLTHLNMLTPRQ